MRPTPHKPPPHWLARKHYRGPALVVFAVLAWAAYVYRQCPWDLRASRGVQAYLAPRALGVMQAVSVPGNGWIPYILTAVTIIALLCWRWPQAAGGLLLSAGGGALLNTLLKWFIGRPRPTAEQVTVFANYGFLSFPSGHVTFYVTYFGFLFLLAQKHLPVGWRRRAALLGLALPVLLISLSRVSLGAHWPSDTLGAYIWSSVWLGFSWQAHQTISNQSGSDED